MRQDREVREDEEYISTTQQHTVTTWQEGIKTTCYSNNMTRRNQDDMIMRGHKRWVEFKWVEYSVISCRT